jgi:lambda family phage portal protein
MKPNRFLDNDPEMRDFLGLAAEDRGTESVPGPFLPPGTDSLIAGEAYEGASRFDREVALWSPSFSSADGDILPQKELADARSRDISRNDGIIGGAITHRKDNIVGSQYLLNSKPEYKILGLDETWAEEFQEEVEAKFSLTAESNNNWLDASRHNTFTEMVRMSVGVHMVGGEVLYSSEWITDRLRPCGTAIQFIDLDRLSTPIGMNESRFLKGGVALDNYGAPLGYHIRKSHPGDWTSVDYAKWKYVPAYKSWGRLQIGHIFEQLRPEQTRAVSELVSILSELASTKKFRKIVLQNAVVNATYAATIESEMPTEAVYQALGGGNLSAADVSASIAGYASGYMNSVLAYTGAKGHRIDGVKIPHLFPGTKLNLRPAANGGPLGTEFETSLLRYIAASLGISYEQLAKDFSKTNYSSARAAMSETWKFMQSMKKIVADRFATSVYTLWLEEMIGRGEITSMSRKAPPFWHGINKEAYSACTWIGASRGQIDELKETQAAVLRIKYNLGSYESELGRLGIDWRKHFAQRERENKMMELRGLSLDMGSDNMMNAASGESRQKEAKGEKDDGSDENTDA